MKKYSQKLEIAGKTLTLETGQLAHQATSSVLARLGDTMVLVTVVEGKVRQDIDYFPLTVEYVERLYAGGRIKGSRWVKREGRPSDDAILTARLIDRSIRPLFLKEYKNEVQIVVTVLSVDGENEPDVLSVIAVSAALSLSRIPWKGPVGSVRIGFVKDSGKTDENQSEIKSGFLVNPGISESDFSELDLVVSQTKDKTLMIEAGAKQVSEEVVLQAIEKAQEVNKEIVAFIEKLVEEVGQKKTVVSPNPLELELRARIEKSYKEDLLVMVERRAANESSGSDSEDLIERIFENEKLSTPDLEIDKKIVAKAVEYVFYKIIRENVLKKGKRPDGRTVEEIRPISAEVSMLPRTHGSAIFQRGSTQSLTVATLGSPKLEQLIESAEGEESKRYIHHYSMPPYSVGETGRIGFSSRREIGHGALAERALMAVIPSQEKFPYTIRVVSEILSSNGSTSMAATCGSTLALMDAGVPIEKPVAGVAMGMMSHSTSFGSAQDKGSGQASDEKYIILTDILGLEDFSGDMDFKVAGTDVGITAIQLDVKIPGLSRQQIEETLQRAKEGRLFILEKMLSVMPVSRAEVSEFAPKIELVHIPTEKIGEVIGPGGRVIRNIIAETGATVDVEDDGTVTLSGTSEESVRKASEWIQGLTREIKAGEVFEGKVKRLLSFGAFVEILPGKEGMVHVSQMSTGFVKNPNDVVSIGQQVKVRVAEIDEQGRINLSMLFGQDAENKGRSNDRYGSEGENRVRRQEPDVRGRRLAPSEHPLSMQFRRERSQAGRSAPWRGGNQGRFRKPPHRA